MTTDEAIARASNSRNNALHQQLRLDRWADVRDALWALLEPRVHAITSPRVAIIGGGSCDDVPLARLVAADAQVDLIDFDLDSTDRARARVTAAHRDRVSVIEHDVTGGCADVILRAVRDDAPLPESLLLPYDPLGAGEYDIVIGDMLYTQLLHAGLIALGVTGERQHQLMRRYDPPLVHALVRRIEASLAPSGVAIHVHDVACWASNHDQPCTFDEAVAHPDELWRELKRHDNCDPMLVLERLGHKIVEHAWWPWTFEPNKQFLVRAVVTRAAPGSSLGSSAVWRTY